MESPLPPTILVADDDPLNRELLGDAIKAAFGDTIEVIYATDGGEAIKILEESAATIDLLMTDFDMPVVNGMAVLEAAQKLGVTNGVLMTGNDPRPDMMDCIEKLRQLGMIAEFKMKPIGVKLTQDFIKRTLNLG